MIISVNGSGCLLVELRKQKKKVVGTDADKLVLMVLKVGSAEVHSGVCLLHFQMKGQLLNLWAKIPLVLYCFPAHMCFGISYLKLRVQSLPLTVYC